MSYAAKALQAHLRRLLMTQVGLIFATAAVYLATKGAMPALAAAFGGGIAVVNSLVSARHLGRASMAAADDLKRGMLELYAGAVTRFVATPALVVVGIVVLKLDPVAIIVGFAVAQVAYAFGNSRRPVQVKPERPDSQS